MLNSLQIENFKGFAKLRIEPLAKVNLIVGAGNSGKTSVLEALSMIPQVGGFVPSSFRDIDSNSAGRDDVWKWISHKLSDKDTRVIAESGMDAWLAEIRWPTDVGYEASQVNKLPGGKRIYWFPTENLWKFRISSVSTRKLSPEALARSYDRWTLRTENEIRFIEFLETFEPRLKSLRPMEHTGQRMLYADVRLPERIALPLLGEGFNRLVQIFGAIIGDGADILLIDEIENGLHWSALPQVWAGIRAAVTKDEVQIFATTHSLECIAAAVEVFKGEPKNDLAVHRLERGQDGEIHCVTMGEDELERMLERNWEIR